jgi:hypothetical protein
MMFLLGVFVVIVSSYASFYLISLELFKEFFLDMGIPYEFSIMNIVFFVGFILYYLTSVRNNQIYNEIGQLNESIKHFLMTYDKKNLEFKTPILQHTLKLVIDFMNEYKELKENSNKKIHTYKEIADSLIDVFDLQSVLVVKVNQDGKVIKANKKLLKFLAYDSEVKLNMNVKNIADIFDEKMPQRWLNDSLGEDLEISIKKVKFRMHIEKVERVPEYVITLIDITEFEEQKKRLEYERNFINKNLKTKSAINKSFEITMIRMLNYDNYAEHLGTGILELFEERISEKINSLGYDEIFKVQDDIFAVYGMEVDFNQHKKILEETIIVEIGEDKYIFNPQIILGSGVNFEQARQQIVESSKTLIARQKEESKYSPEIIKLVNESVLKEEIYLGYTQIQNHPNTLIIEPLIKDGYSNSLVSRDIVMPLAEEFNLYLQMLKILLLNNINLLKDKKLILNVTSLDLSSTTILSDLLTLIKRDELDVVFNVDINSNYSTIYPILKSIKAYAQLGIRRVGKGYISFRDLYALKIDYLEIDDSIIELIHSNPQWKFLVDAVKIIVKGQNSKLIAKKYKDEKIFQISDNFKVYGI